MKIKLKINKTIEENAAEYFEKAKKAKKKYKNALIAIEKLKKKIREEENKQKKDNEKKDKKITKITKKHWYEKFRYFISSEGFLVVGGKDATTNEIIIKKYTEPEDIVFHSSLPGSPFVIVKKGKKAKEKTLQEAADFTAIYSKAWKSKAMSIEVFYVNPEQVTKKTKSGEYMTKGSFMIYGKRNFLKGKLILAIAKQNNKIIYGPEDAIKSKLKEYIKIFPGRKEKNKIAKELSKILNTDVDCLMQILPSGESDYEIIKQ